MKREPTYLDAIFLTLLFSAVLLAAEILMERAG